MKKLFKKLFNKPTITTVVMTENDLAMWLKEPFPSEAREVLDWHNKNIPANDQ